MPVLAADGSLKHAILVGHQRALWSVAGSDSTMVSWQVIVEEVVAARLDVAVMYSGQGLAKVRVTVIADVGGLCSGHGQIASPSCPLAVRVSASAVAQY